ncbi:MAG: orotidine-5'-phosphate decarboxylase [Elusimicrobia bacterium]|nr:orotidine-5'-phosphate decarboxylase [Elusimicrobiota bacterium]
MRDKVIVALDVEPTRAREIVSQTKDLVSIYKIGPVLWFRWGAESLKFFADQGLRVMLDFKFHDIPNTVTESLKALSSLEGSRSIWGATLHASGGFSMLRSAVLEKDSWPQERRFHLFGVTVLTSLKEKDLYRAGVNRSVEAQVKKLAALAQDSGLDGVVASGDEVAVIRKACGQELLVLVPGVRLVAEPRRDLDQKRVVTPAQAVAAGADYLIVGRDIYQSQDPRERVEALFGAMETVKIEK